MQTALDAQIPSQVVDNQSDGGNADAHLPLETKETSADKGAIKCSENSDKIEETEEQGISNQHKGD